VFRSERYGLWARSFYLAFDPEHYRVTEDAENAASRLRLKSRVNDGIHHICVYSRDHTPRRCVALALAGLEILSKRRSDFVVHLFGQDQLNFSAAPFKAVNHGVLDAEELCALYNYCDIGVSFSGTNYSLVPQEMMACGLPIIELDGESTRAVFPEGVVEFAQPSPASIATTIERLLDSPTLRDNLVTESTQWVSQFDWEKSGRLVESSIKEYLGIVEDISAPYINTLGRKLLDVGIPTYNGLSEIVPVIESLRKQRAISDAQIHCVDSSSSDGTTEWLKQQKDIALTIIDGPNFQHGRTRDEMIEATDAPLFAFLTQDATPVSSSWVTDILLTSSRYPRAGGFFGRHIGYKHHSKWNQLQLERHFAGFLDHPLCVDKNTDSEKWNSNDVGWKQFLHFFSDNNAIVSRSTWKDIRYPHIAYGEDQVWANQIISAGWSKVYIPSAAVFHSHEYSPVETYRRSRVESVFFGECFGYYIGEIDDSNRRDQIGREVMNYRRWALFEGIHADIIANEELNIASKHDGWAKGLSDFKANVSLEEVLKL
jgi:GT2 family glycosyltransferase